MLDLIGIWAPTFAFSVMALAASFVAIEMWRTL